MARSAFALPRTHALRELSSGNPGSVAALGIVALLLLASVVAPLPFDPRVPDAGAILQAPNGTYWFGTDGSGSDVFSRTIAAARTDLLLALAGTALSLAIGVPLGLAASARGKGGERLVRGLDAFQAFPLLILALALVSLSGNQLYMVVVAIALINVPRYVRLLRSEILAIRESRFVEAAHATGVGTVRLMRRHLLPNAWGVVLVQTSLTIANAIVVIAALSFLGVGVSPPTPSWGSMIRAGASNMTSGEWWVATFPGLAVLLCVLCFNHLADALGDRLGRRTR